ncbi:protein phosphatase 1 regulatory subunit 14C isoform X2 [Chiroxiphia lanceolata]|uniref:protein phosphatase 1 regulatory subunit 14C isoform X2 n=1 Tax=Chiroxiphia lanceolata TaxID=296741 RepID=UPI0013CED3A1|nr:protein phosphatase 1 regulatory subunit 14C isoform X2 [Chiroxiphia lanceolata]
MSVVTGGSEAAAGGGGGNRVFFQSPRAGGGSGGSSGSTSREDSVSAAAAVVQVQQRRHQQGKVTVKYDRKELRKRLVLEEWIVEQLGQLYGCEKLSANQKHRSDFVLDFQELQRISDLHQSALDPRFVPPCSLLDFGDSSVSSSSASQQGV